MEKYSNTKKITKTTLIWGIISGILLAAVGFIGLFINPLGVAVSTVWAFGFITVFTGAFGLIASFKLKKQSHPLWWALLIQGISGIGLGIYLMTSPIITEVILIQFSGIYLIVFSIARLITSREDWFFIILKIIFGISMIAYSGFFLVWGFIVLFTIFIINGLYSAYVSFSRIKNKQYA